MSGRGDPIEVQKCRATLLNLLKQPQNSTCADCGRKQPTWASTNLGVFVCIGCSGIHRNLGTHISKVKSVNLDSWTYRLVNHFKSQGGNETVNARYECHLPSSMKPDTGATSHMMEGFIRNKYQHRKWYSDTPKERREVPSRKNNERKERRRRRREAAAAAAAAAAAESTTSNDTTPKPKPKPVVQQPPVKQQQPIVTQEPIPDLLDVSSLEPKHDDLLSFEPAVIVQQQQQQQQQPTSASTTGSSFGFINGPTVGPSSDNAFGLSNGPTAANPIVAQSGSASTNGFDFSALPVETSKSTIMSKFHEDPFRPGVQQHPQIAADFMTQLNVNPMQRQQVVQQQQQVSPVYGMGMGFPQQMGNGNPYTMLNAPQQRPMQSQHHHHQASSPYGFGFR